MIVDQTSETKSVFPGSGHHIEESVLEFLEILAYYFNHHFTNPLSLPLIDQPSMRYVDSYSPYHLQLRSTTIQSFGKNPSSFGFPKRLGNSYLSTTPIIYIIGASSLMGTSVT